MQLTYNAVFKMSCGTHSDMHLLCKAHLLMSFSLCYLTFIYIFFIQMVEICFKQYIYMNNFCHLNGLYLEFSKVIF